MKKSILILLAIFSFGIHTKAQVCSLDTFTIPGIYPDTIVNLPKGYATGLYGTVIQVRVLVDTPSIAGLVKVTDITINSVIGLPSGFSYACNPANCVFPGGGNGCIYLSGTPSAAQIGVYPLIVNVTLHGKIANIIPVTQASQILGYKIEILGAPVSDFSASTSNICKLTSTTFSDLSTNSPTSWSWSFPGGTPATSNLQNPTVTYNTSGTYNVTLTASSPAGGNTKVRSAYIKVNALPSATISAGGSLAVCSGSSVLLTAGSGTGYTYQWRKNGVNINNATAQTYQAGSAGSYKVLVTNANGCTSLSSGKNVSVISTTAAATAGGPTTFCTGGSVVLSANTGTGLSYQWQKNNVNLNSATGATYTATASGTYKVIVTNASGCTKASTGIPVTVNSAPSANFVASGPLTFCTGGNVVFTANSGNNFSYQWKRNGNNINGANQIQYTATTAGTYKVIVSKTNGCSKASGSKTVVVNCKEMNEMNDQTNLSGLLVFPNPANEMATVQFNLDQQQSVLVEVFDMQGKLIMQEGELTMAGGQQELSFSTATVKPGIYLVKVSANGNYQMSRLLVSHP